MFLKNKNIIFKIRRSKVTDYAALSDLRVFSNLDPKGDYHRGTKLVKSLELLTGE